MIRIKYILFPFLLAVLIFQSCEYKSLSEPDALRRTKAVTVSYDWRAVDSIPASMRVAFYPSDFIINRQGYTFFDTTTSTTKVELPVGRYDVVAWNNDTEHILTGGYGSFGSLYATTPSYSPHGSVLIPRVLDSLFHSQPVLDYPDYMVHAWQNGFEITDDDSDQSLVLTVDSMVVTVDMEIRGVKGLDWCHAIRGALSNVAARRYFAYGNKTDELNAIMFDAYADIVGGVVRSRFWLFGFKPSDIATVSHQLVLFFWVTGAQVYLPIDVTPYLDAVDTDGGVIRIDLDGSNLDLTEYVRQGSTGITVDAEDWQMGDEIPIGF